MKARRWLLSLGVAAMLASCASAPDAGREDGEPPKRISSVSELAGEWRFCGSLGGQEMSRLEYPFSARRADGETRTFFKFSSAPRDDTALWVAFAREKGLSFAEVWQKRLSYLCELYGAAAVPACDENGSERGAKVFFRGGRVCFQSFALVPESVMMHNCGLFRVRADGSSVFMDDEDGFRFYSCFDAPPAERKLSRGVGLVLSGGGGKGAYEVGVWKALRDYGIAGRVTAFSGTSVGGLNAALFATADADCADRLWRTVVPGELSGDDRIISQDGLKRIIDSLSFSAIRERRFPLIFVTAMRNTNLALKFIGSSVSFAPGKYATRFLLNDEEDEEELKRKLLATSAFPVLTQPVLLDDGHTYIDGGAELFGGDNTPIDPIVENCADIGDIIVVYLSSAPERRVRKIDYESTFILEIIPTIDLGSVFEGTANFGEARIRLLIGQGYRDAAKILRDDIGLLPLSRFWDDCPD